MLGLTDISAAFDKVWHNGLIAKLSQIGIDGYFLNFFKSYLTNRKQCVIVDGVKSDFLDVKAGVPQGSRLGPLLFIIYINDIINDIESDIMIFADDTTLLASGDDPAITALQLNRDLLKISNWAKKWKVTFNPNKSKDMIFSSKYLNNSPPLILNNSFIERVNIHKHLGVFLNSNLEWTKQIHQTCLRANQKLAVLRRIKFLDRKSLDLLYKVIIRSIIDYALPIYANTLKMDEIARLERIQYQAAKLVTGALHFTSKDKLNTELGWESIKKRIDFLGLCLFQKMRLHLTRPLVRKFMPKFDWNNDQRTRSKGGYLPYDNFGKKYLNSFFPYMTKLWNNLPPNIKCKDINDFKYFLKLELKPPKTKHFSKGSKYGNSLLTRLRVGQSELNLHKFSVGLVEKPDCACHEKQESTKHYLLDCFLYTTERQKLFSLVEHYIPKFKGLSKAAKLNLLLYGLKTNDPDFDHLNFILTKAVQMFLIQTKRFSK